MNPWRFMELQPQNARGKLKDSMWDDKDWIAEEKFDGDRRLAQVCYDPNFGTHVRFTGRKKSVVTGTYVEKTENIPQLSAIWPAPLDKMAPPKFTKPPLELVGTVFDGEMIVPEDFIAGAGGKSKHVTSIMGSLPGEAIRKQLERGWLRFAVFDLLFYRGEDIRFYPLIKRRNILEQAMTEWGNPNAFVVPWSFPGQKKEYLDYIQSQGGEGLILKNLNQKYGEEYGGHLKWVKVKFKWNADVIITGYKDAKEFSKKVTGEISITKFAEEGLIGAIKFGQFRNGNLMDVGNTSGMDDETRRYITKNQDALIGRVIEIEHYGREPTGKFRHPQFKGWRDDKNPNDCVYNPEEV